jgi:hypothetical protein
LPPQPTLDTVTLSERPEPKAAASTSPAETTTPRLKPSPKLALSPNGTPHGMNGTQDHFHESAPVTAAPLLSPVAEMRTPSPTHSLLFDKESPTATNGLMKAAKIASAKRADNRENELPLPLSPTASRHERKGSAPTPTTSKPARSPTFPTPVSTTSPPGLGPTIAASAANQNPWQPVTKKGHKKSKSTAGRNSQGLGQAMPVNEGERKGG